MAWTKLKGLVIHHTESADGRLVFDGNAVKGILTARGLRGYHWLHEQIDGQWWTSCLCPMNAPGEHVGGHNSEYLGFAFVGNFNVAAPTDVQFRTAAVNVAAILDVFRLRRADIFRHSDINDTDCPGRLFSWARFCEMVKQV